MNVSINPATSSTRAEAPTTAPACPGDSKVFQLALSAATSTERGGGPKPSGTAIHDRKVHHHASSKSSDTVADSVPVNTPAISPAPPMTTPPDVNRAAAQPRVNVAAGGFPVTQPEQAANADSSRVALEAPNSQPASGDAALPTTASPAAEHEAALRDAIATVQMIGAPASPSPVGQSSISPGSSATLPLKGGKGLPTGQAHLVSNTASSAAPDRQHKAAAANEASNGGSSDSGQQNSSDQSAAKGQVADLILPQSGPVAAHINPAAALTASLAQMPVHTIAAGPTSPTPALPVAAAHPTMLPPEPVATPFVSSARLIQSIQQSDMRVGLNSLEFGSISIHTSTDRGVISSQITLGHEELAKTITTHLAAMQETPGIPQVFSVRVETASPTAGDSSGQSQQSPGDKQQHEGRGTHSRNTEIRSRSEYNLPIATRILDGLDARLDIRI